ncbi:MAG: HWE histidine kinase domain-containing protein, partial [Pseudomonadota bacterium]
ELQTQALPRAAQEGSWEGVTEIKRSDGTRRPISQVIIAHHGEDGEVESFSTIARDISDRIEAEQKQRLLLRELAHRVKNTLTVIQSIARQTLRRTTDPVTFARVFEGRVASLAASHNLLTETDWSGVSLSDVIRSQTTAVASGAVERIVLDGPVVILPSETATRAGLMFHELATNAVKYGALSNDAGQVQISWAAPEDGALAIEWSETGGPEIASAPTARGFGSTLIDMSGGQVQRTFRPEGLWLTVTIPLNEPPKTT